MSAKPSKLSPGRQLLIRSLFIACLFATAFAALGQDTTRTLLVTGTEATTETAVQAMGTTKSPVVDYLQVPITTEMAVRASGILLLFVVIAVAIALRKIPAMVALPLIALGIGLIAGIRLLGPDGIFPTILEGSTLPSPTGAFQLYKAIIYVLFGGMFARFISDSRIAERIVKYAAEFGGEDPFFISLLMAGISILVFTATGGLPMIIMLGTVMFPILLSLGVPPVVVGSLLLLSFPIGSCLNPGDWVRTAEIFKVPLGQVQGYFIIWASIQAAVLLLFLTVEFLRMKRTTVTPWSIAKSVLIILGIALLFGAYANLEKIALRLPGSGNASAVIGDIKGRIFMVMQWLVMAVLVIGVVQSQYEMRFHGCLTFQWNLLTPVLPIVFLLVLGFSEAIIPAFLISMFYGYLTTMQEHGMQKLGRSIINGVSDVAAPVVLMAGIGMLIAAATHPTVHSILTPILARVMPTSQMSYVLFFLFASPLALYRGPLNEFGLGIGIAKLMQHFMPAAATMGALRAVGMLQDPTTTQNIWICGYLKLDINALLFKLFFYSLTLVVLGLGLSALLFYPG